MLYVRARSPYWWCRFSVGGVERRESTKIPHGGKEQNRRLAERYLMERQIAGATKALRAEVRTLAQLKDRWTDHTIHKKDRSEPGRWVRILAHFGPTRQLRSIGVTEISGFRNALQKAKPMRARGRKTLSAASVNRHLALLRSALRYALACQWIDRDPFAGVKLLRESNARQRVISPGEHARLTAAAKSHGGDISHCPPVCLEIAWWTGMRMGAICQLRWEDWHRQQRVIVSRGDAEKTGEGRRVPVAKGLHAALLAEHKRQRRPKRGAIVGSKSADLSPAFRKLADSVGLDDVTFHDYRRSAAVQLGEAGIENLKTIASITGHKTLQMVARYLPRGDKDLLAAVDARED